MHLKRTDSELPQQHQTVRKMSMVFPDFGAQLNFCEKGDLFGEFVGS